MAIPSFSSTVVARAAAALYGSQLGSGTMAAVLEEANATGGVEKLINTVYNRDYAAMSNADVAKMVVANVGITGAGVANAEAYLLAKINAAGPANEGAAIVAEVGNFGALASDATYGAAATAFNGRIAAAVAYAQQGGTSDRAFGAGSTISLTMGQDFLTGTSGNDTIVARIFDNDNTLQSGDWVDGGAGTDKLEADMGMSQDFAVTPETVNVETFSVRAQARANESGDNNVSGEGRVNIDAQRLSGVTRFDSTESRADLIIEDVRTSLRTKDITIGMIGTDAGNVDYAVYFDRLRADGSSVATLSIELMDTRAATSDDAATAALPLKDSPFNGFSFVVNGKTINLRDPVGADKTDPTTFNGALTYPQLLAAIQKMLTAPANLTAFPELAGITAALGANFVARDTLTGIAATGQTIVLSGASGGSLTLAPGNFIADDGVPPSSGLHTVQTTATSSSTDLITSTVILDNVGRGSNGGDLVIGAMSVGETSPSAGIAKFDISVENTSNLGIIASTNNALKEVVVTNGTVKGNLSVKGFDNTTSLVPGSESGITDAGVSAGSGGTGSAQGAVNQHNAYGFNDVRLINMTAMTGTVSYDAQITSRSFAKYIQVSDTDSDPKVDNNSTDGKTTRQVADFDYSGGSGNDTIAVVMDSAVVSSHSRVQVGREDFTIVINGNGGDDTISTVVGSVNYDGDDASEANDGDADGTGGENDDTSYLSGGDVAWYIDHQAVRTSASRNMTINAGDGNDTVRTPGSGDMAINLGAGNDTVYTDNTGALNTSNSQIRNEGRAIWVFNTTDQLAAVADDADERAVDDIVSSSNSQYFMYRASLTVRFLGSSDLGAEDFNGVEALESIEVPVGYSATTYRTSDLHINQAIKLAISTDPVLKKLLVAEDGPGNSLIVRSLIDGVMASDGLSIEITLPDPTDFTNAEIKKVATAWHDLGVFDAGDPEDDALEDLIDAPDDGDFVAFMQDIGLDAFNASQDYESALGVANADDDGDVLTAPVAVFLTGADSSGTTTDNIISGDAGNDVIVLSTTVGASTLESSNERIKYAAIAFGDDTIVNFDFEGTGIDNLDLQALGGFGSAGIDTSVPADPDDGLIIIEEYLDEDLEDLTLADIEALFEDNELGQDDHGEDLELETFVYIAVDEHNVGHVYTVVDNDGADGEDVDVSFMGTIDLADTDWVDLTAANFAG